MEATRSDELRNNKEMGCHQVLQSVMAEINAEDAGLYPDCSPAKISKCNALWTDFWGEISKEDQQVQKSLSG